MVKLTVLKQADYDKLLKERKIVISYGYGDTPFGKCIVGSIENKICHFSFFSDSPQKRLETLKTEWPDASFVEEPDTAKHLIQQILKDEDMEVFVKGTDFQEKVWKALLDIKKGETRFYGEIAEAIGCPKGARGVGNAVAKNPVSYLVPCHRVICKGGDVYKYSGGCETKKKLLQNEGFHDK